MIHIINEQHKRALEILSIIDPFYKNYFIENVEKEIAIARKEINKTPSEGQKKAGNYKMGHVNINGFDISIESPKGSIRSGKDENGNEWSIKMKNDYGYFKKTLGKDGDHIDVFIGPYPQENTIFVIDQNNLNGDFDESKVMMGFKTKDDAIKAYMSNYTKDWKGFRCITQIDIENFKKWLYDGKKQKKPFADYKEFSIKK